MVQFFWGQAHLVQETTQFAKNRSCHFIWDSLRDSIEAHDELLTASEDEARMGRLSEIERIGIRAGVVKHFEITYELSWKLMARWLNTNVGSDTADGVTRRQLYRLSAAHKTYRRCRSLDAASRRKKYNLPYL